MYPFINILNYKIPVYGLLFVSGLIISYFFAYRRTIKRVLSADGLLIISAFAISSAVFGAKILYLSVSLPRELLISLIKDGKFDLLMRGGFVFYGGLAGGIVGAALGAKIAGVSLLSYEAAIVPFIPLGHSFGRIGCFMSGCCFGIPYNGIPGICFPNSLAGLPPDMSVFPVQLLESAANLFICILLTVYSKKPRRKYDITLLYLGLYSLCRFPLEFLRGDMARGLFLSISTSQWISAAVAISCLCYLFFRHKKQFL